MIHIFYAIKAFWRLLGTNVIKTVYVNFRLLPFRQAIKMPLFIYGRFLLRESEGKVVIKGDVNPGMIRIGRHDRYPETRVSRTIWVINGKIEFNGKFSFFRGSYIMVARGAELVFGIGDYPSCGANTRIMCFDRIEIEDAQIFNYNDDENQLKNVKRTVRYTFKKGDSEEYHLDGVLINE